MRYEIPVCPIFRFHMVAGAQYVLFKENSILGTVKENAWGFLARGGGVFRLSDTFGIELFAAWSTCKMAHQGGDFKVGGLDLGGEIEIRF